MIVENVSSGVEAPAARHIRRVRSHFERLSRPDDVMPGEPTPSIEGWVLFLTNLPPNTTSDNITDLFLTNADTDPEGFGPIREIKLPLDKKCECCGYALVELQTREGFERALRELQGAPLPFAEGEPPAGEDQWRLRIAPTFIGEEDPREENEDQPPQVGDKRERED